MDGWSRRRICPRLVPRCAAIAAWLSRANWFAREVAGELEQVLVTLSELRAESSLERVSGSLVALVERLSSACAEPVHGLRKVSELRCHEHVEMIREIAPRVAAKLELRRDMLEQEVRAFVVGGVDGKG